MNFGGFFEIRTAAAENSSAAASVAENSARTAFSSHSFEVKGVGPVNLGVVTFETVFLDRPRVVFGGSLLKAPDFSVWNAPLVSGLVTDWKVDRKGHYVGARIYGTVDISRADRAVPTEYPQIASVLDVLFIGVAYKNLGAGVTSKASTVSVRSSGMSV